MVRELSSIPTLAQLYSKGALKAASDHLYTPSNSLNEKISFLVCDITKLKVDAIVNAANQALGDGSGVNGAIHRAAGPELDSACAKLNGCRTGEAKITKGFNLSSKHIIHTVGPVYREHSPERARSLLADCYSNSMRVAVENGLSSIAFSSISTGIFGYPIQDAASVAVKSGREFLETEVGAAIQRVIYVLFSRTDEEIYKHVLPSYFPPEK